MSLHEHADPARWEWRAGDGAEGSSAARALFTSREGGASPAPWASANIGLHVGDDPERVLANRAHVAALAGLSPDGIAGVTQVHGADVWLDLPLTASSHVSEFVRWSAGVPPEVEADALVTSRAGVGVAVGVADCMPIVVAWGDAVAAIHAGWRSLEAGVIEAAVAVLRRAAGSSAAFTGSGSFAAIGPCLGPCCMEVGEEVAARFSADVVIRREGAPRPFLDARADAVRRLEALGVAPGTVEVVDVCTKCDPRLFSHRGDGGATGRQAAAAWRAS